MPLPKVSSGESEQDYVSRCMEAQAGESKPEDQKLAICYSTYREAKKGDELRGTVEKAALSAGVASSVAKEIAGQAARNYFAGRRRVVIKALKDGVNELTHNPIKVGLQKIADENGVDVQELAAGAADEMGEHNMGMSEGIKTALDHLTKVDSRYYSKLRAAGL